MENKMNNTKYSEKPEKFEGISFKEFYKFLTGFDPEDFVQFADPCDPYAVHPSNLGIWSEQDMDNAHLLVSKLERTCRNTPSAMKKYYFYFSEAHKAYLEGDSVSFKQNIDQILQQIKFEN